MSGFIPNQQVWCAREGCCEDGEPANGVVAEPDEMELLRRNKWWPITEQPVLVSWISRRGPGMEPLVIRAWTPAAWLTTTWTPNEGAVA